jgi:hypothetical protein
VVGGAWGINQKLYGYAVVGTKLYVAGGTLGAGNTDTNLVYSTTNGASWVLESYTATWPIRQYPGLQSFLSTLVILGGLVGATQKFDVWSVTTGAGPTPPPSIPL